MGDIEKILTLMKAISQKTHDWFILPLAILGFWKLLINVASSQVDFLMKYKQYRSEIRDKEPENKKNASV